MKISALVMCYNEQDTIYQCLTSIIPLVDETIVWDGDFWIGTHDPGLPEVLIQGSSDGSRELIERAIKQTNREVKLAYYDGIPKLAEYTSRNMGLQEATGDYLLIVDADEIYTSEKIDMLKRYINENPDVTSFFLKDRLYFWDPFHWVLTTHMRLFKLYGNREFYGANEMTLDRKTAIIPENDDFFFHHYGYTNKEKVREKMKWYDDGEWRSCGSQWFEKIYSYYPFKSVEDLIKDNFDTLHPFGRMHPGFAAHEFGKVYEDYSPTHPKAMRQYFDKMGWSEKGDIKYE